MRALSRLLIISALVAMMGCGGDKGKEYNPKPADPSKADPRLKQIEAGGGTPAQPASQPAEKAGALNTP